MIIKQNSWPPQRRKGIVAILTFSYVVHVSMASSLNIMVVENNLKILYLIKVVQKVAITGNHLINID